MPSDHVSNTDYNEYIESLANKTGMGTTIVSLSNRPELRNITWPVMERYCKKHGYNFRTFDDTLDVSRHPAWSKLLAIKQAMEEEPSNMVVWLDDDVLITCPYKTIQDLVRFTPFENILMTEDIEELKYCSSFNSGLMFCKNTDAVKSHLDFIYELVTKEPKVERYLQRHMWEQSVMDHFHREIDDNFYTVVPMYPIQGFVGDDSHGWFPGMFAAHVPGRAMHTRIQQLESVASVNKWD